MQAGATSFRSPVAEEQAPPDFAAFFAEEHRGLFKALYFVTGSRADAAELMQDAFLSCGNAGTVSTGSTIPRGTCSAWR